MNLIDDNAPNPVFGVIGLNVELYTRRRITRVGEIDCVHGSDIELNIVIMIPTTPPFTKSEDHCRGSYKVPENENVPNRSQIKRTREIDAIALDSMKIPASEIYSVAEVFVFLLCRR